MAYDSDALETARPWIVHGKTMGSPNLRRATVSALLLI